jgi:hypothetical protein|tara:strand:+ start:204 stop:665 length:462 start_codon:yes stop_codon:yes gene_type:complete
MALTKVRSAGFTAGAILQVVQTTTSTAVNASGADVTATGLSVAITPQSTSNKILVTGTVNGVFTNAADTGVNIDVFRGAASSDTKIIDAHVHAAFDTSSTDNQVNVPFSLLDSPSTTSAQTYSVFFNRSTGSGSVRVQSNGSVSNLTLMEVAG